MKIIKDKLTYLNHIWYVIIKIEFINIKYILSMFMTL